MEQMKEVSKEESKEEKKNNVEEEKKIKEKLKVMKQQEDEMMKLFGFSSFATTKGKDHTESAVSYVMKNSKVKR